MPALFRRRTAVLPTLWGWLVILAILLVINLLIFKQLAFFLAKHEPIAGDYLVVEGWLSEPHLLKAIETFEQGNYQRLITTGGPITSQVNPEYDSYAEKAAAFIAEQGFDPNILIAVPAPASAQNRTFLSAVKLRQWLDSQTNRVDKIDVLSSSVHSRRTHQLFQYAFHDQLEIGIIALPPVRYQLSHWWQTSAGIKAVIVEAIGNVHTVCCFDPGEYGSHQEMWGIY